MLGFKGRAGRDLGTRRLNPSSLEVTEGGGPGLGSSGDIAGIRWARPDPRRTRTQAWPASLPGNARSRRWAEAEGETLALVREGRTQDLGSVGPRWEWWPCAA